MTDLDAAFAERVQYIISSSIAGLDEEDRAERIAYCRRNDLHGVTCFEDAGDLRLEWGGRPLAVVPRSVFDDEALHGPPPVAVFTPDVPDDLSSLDGAL